MIQITSADPHPTMFQLTLSGSLIHDSGMLGRTTVLSKRPMKKTITAAPNKPTSPIISRTLTPDSRASDLGNGRLNIIRPKSNTGARNTANLVSQLILSTRLFSTARLKPSVISAPRIRPPGQPACRMFSQCVLLFRYNVAVNGLMTASQVPLANENSHAPIKIHQYAPSLPYFA